MMNSSENSDDIGHSAVLSLGSNIGNREGNVNETIVLLSSLFPGLESSGIYETPEIHGVGAPYMNAVVRCRMNHEYDEFCSWAKEVERRRGRNSETRMRGEVPIDIDVVIWDGEVMRPADFAREFFQIGYRMLICDAVPHR